MEYLLFLVIYGGGDNQAPIKLLDTMLSAIARNGIYFPVRGFIYRGGYVQSMLRTVDTNIPCKIFCIVIRAWEGRGSVFSLLLL